MLDVTGGRPIAGASQRERALYRKHVALEMWKAGKTAPEIADALGMTDSGVRGLVHKARTQETPDTRAANRRTARSISGRKTRDVALDMWQAGASVNEIVAACGYSNANTLTTVIHRSRQAGDPRAVKRRIGRARPVGNSRGKVHFRLQLAPDIFKTLDRAALARKMHVHDMIELALEMIAEHDLVAAVLDDQV